MFYHRLILTLLISEGKEVREKKTLTLIESVEMIDGT